MTSHSTSAAASRNSSFLLKAKYAVVFGAAGSIGAAVAKAFAAEGAEVCKDACGQSFINNGD